MALRFYFGKYQTQGRSNIPTGPVLMAVNHQNAFLDAILVTTNNHRNPYFLARASAFKYRWSRALLKLLRIMPIYRIRDGVTALRKSDEVIEASINVLESKNALMVFPEGNHDIRYWLRPIQKGIARIAFGALRRSDFTLDVLILPIGIQYEHYTKVGSDVLISYGKPIAARGHKDALIHDEPGSLKSLCERLYNEMARLLMNITSNYQSVYQQWQGFRNRPGNLVQRLEEDQAIVSSLLAGTVIEPNNQSTDTSLVLKSVAWVLLQLTRAIFIIPFIVIRIFCSWVRHKEAEFEGSVKFILWMILGPLHVVFLFWFTLTTTDSLFLSLAVVIAIIIFSRLAIIMRRYLV